MMFRFLALMSATMVVSVSSLAADPVVAKMKYEVVDGKKAFGAQWFKSTNIGVANLVLIWDHYDQSVKEGFKLQTAKEKSFISPVLPERCKITSLKGTLNWDERGTSPVSLTVSGVPCADFINALRSTPISIKIAQVEHGSNSGTVESLLLNITELPQ